MNLLAISVLLFLEVSTISGDVKELDRMAAEIDKMDCKKIIDTVWNACMMRCGSAPVERTVCENSCQSEIKKVETSCSEGKKAGEKIKNMSPKEKEEMIRQEKEFQAQEGR